MGKKKRATDKRYVWRDTDTGRFVGVAIADPVVRPRTVTVEKIRKAIKDVVADRRPERSRHKRSAPEGQTRRLPSRNCIQSLAEMFPLPPFQLFNNAL